MQDIVSLFESQEYHQFLGFEVTDCADGFSRLQVRVQDKITNPVGSVHGGVIYSLCAVASSLSALSVLTAGKYTVANDFNISVLHAVTSGLLTIEAKVLKSGKRLVFVGINVFDEYGRLAATGRVTKSVISQAVSE